MSQVTEDLIQKVDSKLLQTDLEAILSTDKDLKEVLGQILDWIEYESKSGILTSILLYNNKTHQLFTGSAPSLPDRYNKLISGLEAGPVAGSCGTAAYFGKQVIVEDIDTDPLWENYKMYALPEGLRSCWSTPIITSGGELLGTFAIYYKEPRKPTEHDLQLIDEIVGLTANVIETRVDDYKKIVGL